MPHCGRVSTTHGSMLAPKAEDFRPDRVLMVFESGHVGNSLLVRPSRPARSSMPPPGPTWLPGHLGFRSAFVYRWDSLGDGGANTASESGCSQAGPVSVYVYAGSAFIGFVAIVAKPVYANRVYIETVLVWERSDPGA